MSKFKLTSNIAKNVAFVGGATLVGALSGATASGWSAPAWGRKEAANEGKKIGALIGATTAAAIIGGKSAGKFVFRRIRGHIVRLKVK